MNRTLNSVDEFASSLEGSGWQADFRQLDRGSQSMRLRMAGTKSMALLRVDLRNRVHQEGLPDASNLTFGLPTRPQAPGRFGRRVLESESLTCFDPRQGLDVVSAPGFSAYTLSFNRQRLSELAAIMELPDPAELTALAGTQRLPKPENIALMRQVLAELFHVVDRDDPGRSGLVLQKLEFELPTLLLHSWFGSRPAPYVPRSNRSRALRETLEFIRAETQRPVSVEELCRASGCSISTLERAFGEHFQVSPKQFLTAVRLNGVRRVLLGPDDHRPIGDIAMDWGFWHLSKFAADYRSMFAELPSATRLTAIR